MAKRSKEPLPATESVPPPTPLLDAPAEGNVPPARADTGPTLGQRVGSFFRFLLRLLLVLMLLAAIIAGLYSGLPLLYQRYVVPVEQNTANMAELQSRQEQTEQQLADLQTKLQTLETVQNQHDGSLTEIDERVGELESEIAARTQSLAALEEIQSELKARDEAASDELERQIHLLKSMELLSRARLFMYQSNFGLARQDVQIARDLLATIRPDASQPLAAELDAVLLRLDFTLANLPDLPVAASDDLDIAWQILLAGLPVATPTGVAPFSPTPVAGAVTSTPTPVPTAPPTATP